MKRILTLLLLVACLALGVAQPAEAVVITHNDLSYQAHQHDLEFFGTPTPLDERLMEAARWAGFYGPVRSYQTGDPNGMNGMFADQVCMWGFVCMAAPEPFILVSMTPGMQMDEVYAILFHEIGHALQHRDWPWGTAYAATEGDADILGAKLLVAYGESLDGYRRVWQKEIEMSGCETPEDGIHPSNCMRIWNVLSQVPATKTGERAEAP